MRRRPGHLSGRWCADESQRELGSACILHAPPNVAALLLRQTMTHPTEATAARRFMHAPPSCPAVLLSCQVRTSTAVCVLKVALGRPLAMTRAVTPKHRSTYMMSA